MIFKKGILVLILLLSIQLVLAVNTQSHPVSEINEFNTSVNDTISLNHTLNLNVSKNITIGQSLKFVGGGILNYSVGNVFRLNHGIYIGGGNGFIDVATKLLVGSYAIIDDWVSMKKNVTIGGNLTVGGNSLFYGNLTPANTLLQDIGSGSNRWRYGYFQNISTDYIDVAYELNAGFIHTEGINATYLNITEINVDSLNVTTINASYIFNPYFPGYFDLRADPIYLGGADFQIAENLIVDKNITLGGYINGVNISNLSTQYVPYTGATSDVDLGVHNLTTTGYGFFSWLGSLTSRITKLWANDINTINITATYGNFTNMTIAGVLYYETSGACDLGLNASDCKNSSGRYIIG